MNQKAKQIALEKLNKFSKLVTIEDAWLLFYKIKDQYQVQKPYDIVKLFKSGKYDIPGETVSIMKIISNN